MIKQNNNIKGLQILDEELLLSQFADDTTFFLDGRKESFVECMHMLDLFASISGLKLNYRKTVVVWIGRNKNLHVKWLPELDLCWNPDKFKVLGIFFSKDVNTMVNINYENKLNEIRKLLNVWSMRNLTPFGKVTVIKNLALSKIVHLMMNLPDPSEQFLNDLNRIFFKFIWNGKTDKIKRTRVCQEYEHGRLKMTDLKVFLSALNLKWLKRILLDDGKITKTVHNACPPFANILTSGR